MIDFIERNKNRFIFAASLVGGVYAFTIYVKLKLAEIIKDRDDEKLSSAFIHKRFTQNMADCKETSLSLVPLLYNPLFSLYNIEELIASLQTLKSTSKSLPPDLYRQDKIQKWEVIKLKTFTRTCSSIYLTTMTAFFTCIQMSLLGRYLYLDECQSVFDPQILTKRTISPVQETEIMRLTAFFLSIGWKKVILKVEEAVNDTLLNVPLGYLTTNEWIKSTILIIRKHVDMNSMILDYLMDDMKEHDVNNIRLSIKSQIDELKDILESSDARDVFHGCLDDAFNVMIESMHPIYFPEATDIIQDESKIIEVQEESKQIVLAGILPKLSRFASQAVSQTPNLYANVVSSNALLAQFCQIIYTNFE